MTGEELARVKTQVRYDTRLSLNGETVLEENFDHEDEVAAAATRENVESPDNPPIEDIVIRNKESKGNKILCMKIHILKEFSKVQHSQ